MAKFRKGSRPDLSLSFSARIKKGKYKQGPYVGLWNADGKVVARGSVKENYLEELVEFLTKSSEKEYSVGVSLFKNKKKRDEEEDDEDEGDEDEDGEDEDDDDEEEDAPSKKKGKKGKKSDWGFDDDD